MFLAEFRKLFSWKPLFIILALLLSVNAFLLFNQEQSKKVSSSFYHVLWEEIEDKTDTEKLDYLQQELKNESFYNEDGTIDYDRYILTDRFREQLESILSYDEYIESIENKTSSFSSGMFNIDKNSFTYRKNLCLPEVYKDVKGTVPVFDISDGIIKLTENRYSDLFCGIFLFIAAIIIIIRDREQNTIFLLRSTENGRQSLLLNRFFIMFILSVIVTLIFFTESFIICRYFYRFGNLLRPVQSLDGFIGCALPVSVLGYISICFLIKCIFMFLLSSVFIFICQTAKSNLHIYITTAIILGSEYVLYKKTSGLFSQLNIICFTDINQMTKTYQDINLFGYPFSRLNTSFIAMLIVIAFFIILSMYFEKKHISSYRNYSFALKKKRTKRVLSPIGYVFYHSLIVQKAIYMCAALVIISAFQFFSFNKPYDINDTYYHAYVNQTEGPITGALNKFFEEENMRFNSIEEEYNKLSESGENTAQLYTLEKQLEPRQAMQELENHIQKTNESIKNKTCIFYDSGYVRLFTFLSDEKVTIILITLIYLVFTISPLIASDFENGMINIIRSTTCGKISYYKRKIFIALIYAAFANIILWIPYFVFIIEKYTLPYCSLLVQNIRGFEQFPFHISIITFGLVYILILFIAIILLSMIMLLISRCTKSRMSAIILNSCIFILPPVLKLIGIF